LVEVVVATSVLVVVFAALAAVIIVVFTNSDGVATTATNARDEQLVGTYFTRDVESASAVSTSGAGDCAPRPIIEIERPDYTVDYYWTASTGGPAILHRQTCQLQGPQAPASDDHLVRALDTTFAPAATCAPDPACVGPGESVTLTFHMGNDPQAYSITVDTRSALPQPDHTGRGD
jgi:hypothetical protein